MSSHSRRVKPRRRRAQGPASRAAASRPSAPRPPDPSAETLPVKQTRSRETVNRLLDAAEALLIEGGLERATVPNIAARAGLSVGVVYRRFPDKDALVRAVYERFFDRARAASLHTGNLDWWRGIALPDIARTLVTNVVAQHRHNRHLLRALAAYTSTADAAFRRRVDELNAHTMDRLASILLARRAKITHPQPERAVRFGLFVVAAAMRAMIQSDDARLAPFGIAEGQLADELTRMYLRYLGVSRPPTFNPLLHRRPE